MGKTVPSSNATEVTLSTIMPVVFDAADVRVLSFNLKIETTDQFSAEAIRKATPIYEQIMVATIEGFLRNKSYNDILDHCCFAWNQLIDQPWNIMSIGHREWAHR